MKMIQYNKPTNEWNALLNDSFGLFSPLFGTPSHATSYTRESNGVSWFEDEDNYYARVEMPGIKKDELQVEAEDGLLRVSYEAAKSGECSEGKCETSRYSRTLRVPEKVDLSMVGAKLEDGILSLSLPKAEESKPVSIQIN